MTRLHIPPKEHTKDKICGYVSTLSQAFKLFLHLDASWCGGLLVNVNLPDISID